MAGEPKADTGPARMEVEIARPVSVQADPVSGETRTTSTESTTMDFDPSGGIGPEEDNTEALDQEEGSEPDQESEPQDTPEGDLPDYDPDNEEVTKAYDAKFFTEEGTVNLPALSGEFFKNLEAGEGKLNPGTYAFLKATLGLDEAAVKEIERGQMALREASETTFYKGIEGGKPAYEAAIAWAVGGGYTEAQRAAYNEAQSKGGEAFRDAVDALMARAKKGGAVKSESTRRGPPAARRPGVPQRDVTGGSKVAAGAPAGDRFADAGEYGKAWSASLAKVSEAKASGDRAAIKAAEGERDAIRKKARRGYVRG